MWKQQNGRAAEPGELHDTGFGHESRTTRAVGRDGSLQTLAEPRTISTITRDAPGCSIPVPSVSIPVNDAGDEFAVEILAHHHHHAALAPVTDAGKNLAMPDGHNKTLPRRTASS